MKTLRLIRFTPSTGTAIRYWEENGFRRNDTLTMADLTPEQQQIVAGAMAWASSRLPDGMEVLESVELRKADDIPTAWSDPDVEGNTVPTAFSPSFVAAVVGSGDLGQAAIEIRSEVGDIANAMNSLWESLTLS